MLDYDREADLYDRTRGGLPRAQAAAGAITRLLPTNAASLLDVACGTGIVTAEVNRPGLRRFGVDRSAGMAGYAHRRIGRVLLGDAGALPIAAGTLDAVTTIWLLHLIDDVPATIAEAARVLRPGGVLITTVDKDAAHDVGTDVDDLLRPLRNRAPSDAFASVCKLGADCGLTLAGETAFIGHGQGRSPASAARNLRAGYFSSGVRINATEREAAARRLEQLPDQDLKRADPVYRVIALKRS
ncbi:MAG TPA: class I SAM-dependent methyltransferase [Micromonosporaceae bacterium]